MEFAEKRKPFIDLRHILEISDGTLSIVGLFLNTLLLYLIIFKTGERLKQYRRILLLNCIVDIIYNCTNTVTRTQTEYKDGNFFLIMTNTFGHVSPPYSNYLICSWIFALYFCVTGLPVQFVYRYLMIVKGIKVSGRQYILLLFAAIIPPIIHVCYSLFVFWPREPFFSEKQKMLESDAFYYREIPSFITADIRGWHLCILFLYCYFLIFVSYTIVIWANYKVWKHLKMMESHMSIQIRDVHQQMTRTLIVQATVPLIVCFFPIGITLTMVFLHASPSGVGICVSLLLSWIPATNSIMTIIVVKTYRKTVISYFHKCCFKKNPQATSTVFATSAESKRHWTNDVSQNI